MTALEPYDTGMQNSAAAQSQPPEQTTVLSLQKIASLLERILGGLSPSASETNDPDELDPRVHLSVDTAIDLLSNRRRREIILQVQALAPSECLTVDALAHLLGAMEEDCNPDEVSEEKLSSITTSLVHRHLSTLDGHDVVEYDRDAQTVRCGKSVSGLCYLIATISARCGE